MNRNTTWNQKLTHDGQGEVATRVMNGAVETKFPSEGSTFRSGELEDMAQDDYMLLSGVTFNA